MNKFIMTDGASRYARIGKREARQLFDSGKSLYVIAHKMRPGFPFSMGMTVDGARYAEEGTTFDAMVNNFCYYNCSHETGYYPAFYVVTEKRVA